MAFGKKEDEDFEEEELEEVKVRKRPRTKDFKDLKPENRKRRKEPKKPWGRKERLFILFIVMTFSLISAFFTLTSRSWKLPGLPRLNFKLPKIGLPLLSEERIIIEGRKKEREISNKVVSRFNEITKGLSGVYGFYVIDLERDFSYGFNEEEVFEPASLNKLPVMLGLFMGFETGNFDPETEYVLKKSDKLSGSGSLRSKPEGFVLSYRELIRYMGKESDNTAYNIAKNILGKERIEKIVRFVGMERTTVLGDKQKTTPKDIAIFFKKLYLRELLGDDFREEFLEYLTKTSYENYLAAGVPEDVRVAHKFGKELHVINDAGIVFSKKPYIVVIMSKGIVEKEADIAFPLISKVIFEEENVE